MGTLAIKAVVSNADGSLFYREEHEWSNVDPTMMAWFMKNMAHLSQFGATAAKKYSGGSLSAELSADIDGIAAPVVSFSGFTQSGLVAFEREFHRIGKELIDLGDAKAKGK